MQRDEVLNRLRELRKPENLAAWAPYGINPRNTLGVSAPALHALARTIGKDHDLALALWDSGVHEARILAALIDDPRQVTEEQADAWVADLDSWDVCDGCCGNLFDKLPFAYEKAAAWSGRDEEFVKRASYAPMTQLAVHDKKTPDALFLAFLPLIVRGAGDDRNFVKKAVNWALRQIGKRNPALNAAAIATAHEVRAQGSRPARWIATDALRELTSDAVQQRFKGRRGRRPPDGATVPAGLTERSDR